MITETSNDNPVCMGVNNLYIRGQRGWLKYSQE
jgi:hypothetical protein